MRTKVALVLVLLIAAGPVVGGLAMAENTTNETVTPETPQEPEETPEETPQEEPEADEPPEIDEGPYSIQRLRQSGVDQGVENAESTRALGDPPMGFIAIRYRDPTLFDVAFGNDGQWRHIQTGSTVRQDRLQVYGSAFGDLAGDYDLKVVYWQYDEHQTDNGTVAYAANQTVDTKSISIDSDDLYSFNDIQLESHTEQTWRVTMWIEQDGDPVDGAQWRFMHRSNPESEEVDIGSAAGAWGFTLRNAVFPGIASLIIGLVGARATIRKTGRGPGYGVSTWVTLVGFVGMIVGLVAYYQIAVILSNLPWVMGISIGVIAYGAGLTFHQPEKKIGFLRRELNNAQTIPGGGGSAATDGGEGVFSEDAGAEIFDEFTEALYLDLPEVPAVRTDDGYRIPVRGIRPFFARLFADSALLDVSNIATRQKVSDGRLDDIIAVDPSIEKAIEHKSARLVRVLPIDTLDDDADGLEELSAYTMTAAIVAVPPTMGWWVLGTQFDLGVIGALVGLAVTCVFAYSAEDGWIDFKAAPPHYQRAEDSLTVLQRSYKFAKEDESAKKEAWSERAKTAKEGLEEQSEKNRTVTDEILDKLGAGEGQTSDSDIPQIDGEKDD